MHAAKECEEALKSVVVVVKDNRARQPTPLRLSFRFPNHFHHATAFFARSGACASDLHDARLHHVQLRRREGRGGSRRDEGGEEQQLHDDLVIVREYTVTNSAWRVN